jgi:hypothetical protein
MQIFHYAEQGSIRMLWMPCTQLTRQLGPAAVVVFTRRSGHEAVLGAWLADSVRRGQKVLVLRAPGEDDSLLDRLLAAAALDPSGLTGSGQVENAVVITLAARSC